jgi:hypothetical protein
MHSGNLEEEDLDAHFPDTSSSWGPATRLELRAVTG